MCTMVRACIVVFGLLNSGSGLAQEGPGTKFRGLYINMPRSELTGDGPILPEFPLLKPDKFVTGEFSLETKDGDACAFIRFDNLNRIISMILPQCFFHARDLDYRAISQELVNHYPINEMKCKSLLVESGGNLIRTPSGYETPKRITFECSGFLKTGELITVNEGGATKIERRTVSQRPKFD